MKKKIYGRKAGSKENMALLIEGDGVSTGGVAIDQVKPDEHSVASARRAVQAMRERGIEGYVVFEGDAAHYEFTPAADFVYPASSFPLDELNPGWVKGWGVVRMAPWDFAGLFLTRKLADDDLAARGADYVVGYGSRRIGSNDFVFD
jgi:hypothetical protein